MEIGRILTGDTHGFGTFHLEYEKESHLSVFQLNVPLVEGGLLFSGPFSSDHKDDAIDLLLHIGKEVVDLAYVRRIEEKSSSYLVSFRESVEEMWRIDLHASPFDPRQFYGTVQSPNGEKVKFTYKDLDELVIGTVIVVIVGVAAVLCGLALIVGHLRTRQCKKIKLTYCVDHDFKKLKFTMKCNVECLD